MIERIAVDGWLLTFVRREFDDVDELDREVYQAESEDERERFRFRVKPTDSRWDVRDVFVRHPRMRRRISSRISERIWERQEPVLQLVDGGREEARRERQAARFGDWAAGPDRWARRPRRPPATTLAALHGSATTRAEPRGAWRHERESA